MGFEVKSSLKSYEDHDFFTPKPGAPVTKCEVLVFVLHDLSRVFIGGGEMGFNTYGQEADDVEIHALAERFKLPELNKVLENRARNGASPIPLRQQYPRG